MRPVTAAISARPFLSQQFFRKSAVASRQADRRLPEPAATRHQRTEDRPLQCLAPHREQYPGTHEEVVRQRGRGDIVHRADGEVDAPPGSGALGSNGGQQCVEIFRTCPSSVGKTSSPFPVGSASSASSSCCILHTPSATPPSCPRSLNDEILTPLTHHTPLAILEPSSRDGRGRAVLTNTLLERSDEGATAIR